MIDDNSAFLQRYEKLVHNTVFQLRARLKLRISTEELVQTGMLGLVEARSRFDPSSGATFEGFAFYRIRGAVLDSLRRASTLTRRQIRSMRDARAANEYVESLAEAFPVAVAPEEDIEWITRAVEGVETVARIASATDDDTADDRSLWSSTPERTLRRKQMRELLHRVLMTLPPDEQSLLHSHYFDGHSIAAAGEAMGLSRSWACRLHARAIGRLRVAMDEELRVKGIDEDATRGRSGRE